ncbi:hypothetical protein [Methylophaga sp.]|uniref:hypothetical protein n=1 Tax=Methylophaga sp. TaxID=2024840 RepID=UPI0013FF941B|nr:hypothetical protein [Methylophaga sp.]MTI63690.1 hypothetical protein [Methylophaga sp.]
MKFTQIRLITAVISLFLSLAAYYFDDIINRDGVMYMEMVQAYMSGGLNAMADIYDWGFFTLLVAWLSELFSSPIEFTASALNSILFVVFTDALLLISRQLLPNLRQIAIAAVLILAFFSINDYRDFIIRDIGYWAFTTLGLYHLIRYQSSFTVFHAVSWQIAILTAVLFRIEGVVLLGLLPLFVFYKQPLRTAARNWINLNSLVLPLLVTLSAIVVGQEGWVQAFGKFSDYLAYINTEALTLRAEQKLTILEEKILTPFSAEYSALILYSGLLVMLAYKLLEGLSIGYLILLGFARWQNRQRIAIPHRNLIVWFFILNLIILMAFLFRQYFVVSRYCVMTVVSLFLLVLPYLTRLIEETWLSRRRWWLGLFAFIVLAGLIDTFHSTNSKAYIKNTAIWAAHELQAEDRLITDDEFIQYYLKREKTNVTITYRPQKLGNYQNFDYILLVEKRRPTALKPLSGIRLELVHQEKNQRGNRASVYRVVKDDR